MNAVMCLGIAYFGCVLLNGQTQSGRSVVSPAVGKKERPGRVWPVKKNAAFVNPLSAA